MDMQDIGDMLNQRLTNIEKELEAKQKEMERLEKQMKELEERRDEVLDIMAYKQIPRRQNIKIIHQTIYQTTEPKRSATRKEQQVQMLFKLVPELILKSPSGIVKAGEINQYVQQQGAIVGEGAGTRISNILFACMQRSNCPFQAVPGRKGYYKMK